MNDTAWNLDAIYENGVFRPLSPVPLPEHQRVGITVTPQLNHPLSGMIEDAPPDDGKPVPTLEEVRRILAKLPGSLADDIIAEREDRF